MNKDVFAKPLVSRRIPVDVAAEAARLEQQKKALESAGALSWPEQSEQIRRANSILLSRVINEIENPQETTDQENVIMQLQRCSAIAKQWTAEERHGNANADGVAQEPTNEQLMKSLKK